ncbi:hypothetical protein BDZ45DRAFT_800632 [Acephala macrosclerotiorum]|nr:hypothetical protein BDZ45DRAFT_800632 [Acephala macrosclerotiorum]
MASSSSSPAENDEKVWDGLPDHVAAVGKGLLNFRSFVVVDTPDGSSSNKTLFLDVPLTAYKTPARKASHLARDKEFVESASELSRGALMLETKSDAECGQWANLYEKAIGSQMDEFDGSIIGQVNTVGLSRFEKRLGHSPSSTVPDHNFESDLYLGFQTYSPENLASAPFGDEISSKTFAESTLSRLIDRGLHSRPDFCLAENLTEMKLDSQNRKHQALCFPWCMIHVDGVGVVEAGMKNDERELELLARASSAATAVLSMFETLARYADMKQDDQHIPPVVTITAEGANVTVWLAYFEVVDERRRDHNIQPIWNGDIAKAWDALQFCRIMDNILFWAQNILRPKVAHYIQLWMLRHYPEFPNLHSRLEHDRETAELVYRIQDRLNALGISPTTHLPELIQQAVIFKEVMRLNLEPTNLASNQAAYPCSEEALSRPQHGSQAKPLISEPVSPGIDKGKGKAREEDGSDKSGTADNGNVEQHSAVKNVPTLTELSIRPKGVAGELSKASEGGNAMENTKQQSSIPMPIPPSKPTSAWCVDGTAETPFSFRYKLETSDFEFRDNFFTAHFRRQKSGKHPKASRSRLGSSLEAPLPFLLLRTRAADYLDVRSQGFGDHSNDPRPPRPNEQIINPKTPDVIDSTSSTPNPFTATSFELSFPVETWWVTTTTERNLSTSTISLEAGLGSSRVSNLVTFTIPKDSTRARIDDFNDRLPRADPPKRSRSESQPRVKLETKPETVRTPGGKLKIPFKDKFIPVKLPHATAENKQSVHISMNEDGTLCETTIFLD